MSQGRLLVACDFGTTEFRALVTELTAAGGLELVAWGREEAAGFQDGDFVDLHDGARRIQSLLRAVENAADIDITGFTYNIAGSHLRSVLATGQIRIGPAPRPIRQADIDAALAKARSLVIPFDQQIVAANPMAYRVDRVGGIVDPRGRIGSQLEVEVHLITGSRSVIRNIETAIDTAGYSGAGGAVDVLATASALLVEREKLEGALLVDVGGTATQWAIIRSGQIVDNGMIPWGGVHLTADLAHGLRVSLHEAERIKRQQGVVLRSLEPEIETEVLFGEECPRVSGSIVAAILEPRLEEIFSHVKQELGDAKRLPPFGAGMILTGEGARCRGSVQLAEEVFDLPVQCRHQSPVLGSAERLPPGQWATAAGLSLWAADVCGAAQPAPTPNRSDGRRFLQRIRSWVKRGRPRSEKRRHDEARGGEARGVVTE
jgi:cell division protein FtsA